MLWYRFILYSCVVSTCEQHIYIYISWWSWRKPFKHIPGKYIITYVYTYASCWTMDDCPWWFVPFVSYPWQYILHCSFDAFWTSMEAYQYWHRMGSEGVYFFQATFFFATQDPLEAWSRTWIPCREWQSSCWSRWKISTSWMMTTLSSSLWPREVNSFFFQIMGAFPT